MFEIRTYLFNILSYRLYSYVLLTTFLVGFLEMISNRCHFGFPRRFELLDQ
jgi:hypothetical protein